jgi:hypothetical protein
MFLLLPKSTARIPPGIAAPSATNQKPREAFTGFKLRVYDWTSSKKFGGVSDLTSSENVVS